MIEEKDTAPEEAIQEEQPVDESGQEPVTQTEEDKTEEDPEKEPQEEGDPEEKPEEKTEEDPEKEPEEEPEKEPEEEPEKDPEEKPKGEVKNPLLKSLIEKHLPDQEFDSDDNALKAIEEKIESDLERIKANDDANKELVDIFKENPQLVELIHLIQKGAELDEALPYVTGEKDPLTDIDDDEKEWAKTAQEKAKAKKEQEKALTQVTSNVKQTIDDAKAFGKENSMDEKQVGEFLTRIDEIFADVSKGKITKDTMERLLKGLNYDRDIKEKTEKAEIRGRNDAIDEVKNKKPAPDKLPNIKSSRVKEDEPTEDTPEDRFGKNIESWAGDRPF